MKYAGETVTNTIDQHCRWVSLWKKFKKKQDTVLSQLQEYVQYENDVNKNDDNNVIVD